MFKYCLVLVFIFFCTCGNENLNHEKRLEVSNDSLPPIKEPKIIDTFLTQPEELIADCIYFSLDSLEVMYYAFDPFRSCYHCNYTVDVYIEVTKTSYLQKLVDECNTFEMYFNDDYVCDVTFDIYKQIENEIIYKFSVTGESSENTIDQGWIISFIDQLYKRNVVLLQSSDKMIAINISYDEKVPVKLIEY